MNVYKIYKYLTGNIKFMYKLQNNRLVYEIKNLGMKVQIFEYKNTICILPSTQKK